MNIVEHFWWKSDAKSFITSPSRLCARFYLFELARYSEHYLIDFHEISVICIRGTRATEEFIRFCRYHATLWSRLTLWVIRDRTVLRLGERWVIHTRSTGCVSLSLVMKRGCEPWYTYTLCWVPFSLLFFLILPGRIGTEPSRDGWSWIPPGLSPYFHHWRCLDSMWNHKLSLRGCLGGLAPPQTSEHLHCKNIC